MLLTYSKNTPPPICEDYAARMEGPDQGIINAWLAGLHKRKDDPALAQRAEAGELPILPYRGGIDQAIKTKNKVGHLLYVAMWQGLRGQDLHLDTNSEPMLLCTRTGVAVVYTMDFEKLRKSA